MSCLVSAASKHGATAEIAGHIATLISASGIDVQVVQPDHVVSLDRFDAVVLGSALYAGRWLEPATRLAGRIGQERRPIDVWLFSSGPVGDPSKRLRQSMTRDPVELPRVMSETGAHEHQLFAGKLDRAGLTWCERAALVVFRGLEGDYRDWAAVSAWADEIAEALVQRETVGQSVRSGGRG